MEDYGERLLVLDTRDGSRFAVERPAPGRFWKSVGGGHVLWACPLANYRYTPRMFDLAARAEVPVGGREMYERFDDASGTNGRGITLLRMGSTWMVGVSEPCYHCEQFFHLNWRTGETAETLGGARDVQDLDAAGGARRVCAPIRRRRFEESFLGARHPWSRLVAAGRWAVDRGRLRRCGSGRTVRRLGSSYALTPRYAVWLERRTLVVRHLSTGRERARKLSMRRHAFATLGVACDRVYVNDGDGSPRVRRWRLVLR